MTTKNALPTAMEFYNANATINVNVPRVGHPEDKSGWDGVRRASPAKCVAADALVMTLADACDFAEKYAAEMQARHDFDHRFDGGE